MIECRKLFAFPEVAAMSIADEESFAIEKVARGQESVYPASPGWAHCRYKLDLIYQCNTSG